MAIMDDLFSGNMPAVGIASAILGAINANKLRRNATNVLAPNALDQSYQNQYQYYADQLRQLTGELANVNNPQFQSRVQQRMDEIMRSHTDALRQQQSLQAARAGRGLGSINPERRDEAMSKNLAVLRQQAEAQARAEVTKELATAAQAGNASLQNVGQSALLGAAADRNRAVRQQDAKDYYGQTGQQAYLALAKELLPFITKMNMGKTMGAIASQSNGSWDQIPGMKPFTPAQSSVTPAQSSWGVNPSLPDFTSGSTAVDPSDWWAQSSSVDIPSMSGAWDVLPDFSVANAPDMSDWWAQDSSVSLPDFDWGSGWGTGDLFGNMDYGQFF